jgi:hypothetical protein
MLVARRLLFLSFSVVPVFFAVVASLVVLATLSRSKTPNGACGSRGSEEAASPVFVAPASTGPPSERSETTQMRPLVVQFGRRFSGGSVLFDEDVVVVFADDPLDVGQ